MKKILFTISSACAFIFSLLSASGVSAGNNAQFISQAVPQTMTAGQTYSVSVVMKNTGTAAWTETDKYRLGSQNPQDNWVWREGRVYLAAGESIAPGQTKTFTFDVKAPATPGAYNFQWQMVQDGVEWFGEKTSNTAVSVINVICPAGQISGCEVCLADGSGWADNNSKCAGNQICRNGLCLKKPSTTLADLWNGTAVLSEPELIVFNGRPASHPLEETGRVALVNINENTIYAYFRQTPAGSQVFGIYMAISNDGGKTFQVRPNPIIIPQEVIGLGKVDTVYDPDVIKLADGYYMLFEGAGAGCAFSSFIAFSADGINNWQIKGVPVCSKEWGKGSASTPSFIKNPETGEIYANWPNVQDLNKIATHHQIKLNLADIFTTATSDVGYGQLPQSPAGSWDSGNFGSANTIYENGYHYMFFEGSTDHRCSGFWGIGMARTNNLDDPNSWVKFNGNPFFISPLDSSCWIQYPEVITSNGDYYLYYYDASAYWRPTEHTKIIFRRAVKPKICNGGAAAQECRVCKIDGTGWVDDDTKCASGKTCQNGACVLACADWVLSKNIGGVIKNSPIAGAFGDALVIAGRGGDDATWINEYKPSNSSGNWYSIGGMVAGKLRFDAGSNGLRIQIEGEDGSVWQSDFESSGAWSQWMRTERKTMSSAGPDTVFISGNAYKVARASNGSVDIYTCSKNKVCISNQVSGCKVCFADGSGWADNNSKCAAGQVCSSGSCVPKDSCVAKTCAALGNYQCGSWSDGCGATISCGACTGGKTCNASGQCVLQTTGGPVVDGSDPRTLTETSQKLTRAEILQKIAEVKKLLIQLIIQLIAELQKQLAAMPKMN